MRLMSLTSAAAEAGYAAYVFDFRGGTVGGNRSDGSNSEMSILTEASDLESVLAAAKTWDFVDPDKIVLLGGSMGGLVTTVVGSTHQDEIAGMILMYPALSAKDDSGAEQYQSEDDVPEDVSLFGGWIHVGKNYITDLWTVDFDQLLSSYQGHMLLLHGDKDSTVPISYSEAAREIIPDCEFYVIKDGGHEFFGQPFEDAMSYILPYLEGQLSGENVVSESEEGEAMLQMTIGKTPVEAAMYSRKSCWERGLWFAPSAHASASFSHWYRKGKSEGSNLRSVIIIQVFFATMFFCVVADRMKRERVCWRYRYESSDR